MTVRLSICQKKYLGIMNDGTTTKVERFNNSGERPAAPYAATGSDWAHVDAVISKTDTTIYVNGEKYHQNQALIS